MPEFYITFAQKYFPDFFFLGGGGAIPCPGLSPRPPTSLIRPCIFIFNHQYGRYIHITCAKCFVRTGHVRRLLGLLKFYRGKNPSLPRLSCGYRGKFPAAPVESAPMGPKHKAQDYGKEGSNAQSIASLFHVPSVGVTERNCMPLPLRYNHWLYHLHMFYVFSLRRKWRRRRVTEVQCRV